jgi:hypothetical protein
MCRIVKFTRFSLYIRSSSRRLFQDCGTGGVRPLTWRIEIMGNDVQKLHDAVKMLGDAALDIATALSAFIKEELSTGEFRRPGDPKPVVIEPTIAGTGTGLVKSAERKPFFGPDGSDPDLSPALTPERFHKLISPGTLSDAEVV